MHIFFSSTLGTCIVLKFPEAGAVETIQAESRTPNIEVSCPDLLKLPARSHHSRIHVQIKEPAPSEREIVETTLVIAAVQKRLLTQLNVPEQIYLVVARQSNFAGHQSGSDTVTVSYQRIFDREIDLRQKWYKPKSKHPKFTRAIIAHEYGHAIFDANIGAPLGKIIGALLSQAHNQALQRHALEIQDLRTKLERLIQEREAVENKQKEILQLRLPFEEYRKLIPLSADLYQKRLEVESQLRDIVPLIDGFDFYRYKLPYSELYADVVAVLYADDLSAIRKSLEFAGASSWGSRTAKNRDFARTVQVKGWRISEDHDLFSPTRSYIGKYLINSALWSKNKAYLLREITQVILEELVDRAGESDSLILTPEELNRRLIDRLHARFFSR